MLTLKNQTNLLRIFAFAFFVSWQLLCDNHIVNHQKFILLTMLYNETNSERQQEYITCMESNLHHQSIEHIHVFFDTTGNSVNNKVLAYIQSKQISITFIKGRVAFGELCKTINDMYKNKPIIISNADIYFDETLMILENFDLTNNFLALTRWDIHKDKTESLAFAKWDPIKQKYIPFGGQSYSQDTWIFKSPLLKFKDTSMQLGTLHFDPRLAYQANQAGLQVINPCLTIKCHHLHLSNVRHYHWTKPEHPHLTLPFISL